MNYGSFGGGGFGNMPMMPNMGNQERMTPAGEMMFVDGAHQLYSMRMMPGADRVFFDKNEDVFYIVGTNHYGQPQIKAYCFEEIPSTEASGQYVTKQELRELMQEFLGEKGGGGGDK